MLEVYASHVEGSPACTALVVSERGLSDTARKALAKSLASLGFAGAQGKELAFAVLHAENERLGAADALAIVEGLDPLCLVIADAASADLLSRAYRCPIELDATMRLLGRPCASFKAFEDMLSETNEKQRAWAILKRIPRVS